MTGSSRRKAPPPSKLPPRAAILAGIDPGAAKKTGVALWDRQQQVFLRVESMTIIEAMELLRMIHRQDALEIWFEDARQRRWFGKKDRESLQGAGSIKRDSSIWEEFCRFHTIPYRALAPGAGSSKWSAEYFAHLTKWPHRTNEHSRDAAVLVFGRR